MSDLSRDPTYPRLGSGKPYTFFKPSIGAALDERQKLVKAFNDAQGDSAAGETAAGRLFKSIGEGSVVMQPLWVEWGSHTTIGAETFIGPNATLMDTGGIEIGTGTLIGPRITIATVTHPFLPSVRRGINGPEVSRPVKIGNLVWIGANVTVLSGLTVGDGSVIGAGSVVTRNVPEREVWFGNPARRQRGVEDVEEKYDWSEAI